MNTTTSHTIDAGEIPSLSNDKYCMDHHEHIKCTEKGEVFCEPASQSRQLCVYVCMCAEGQQWSLYTVKLVIFTLGWRGVKSGSKAVVVTNEAWRDLSRQRSTVELLLPPTSPRKNLANLPHLAATTIFLTLAKISAAAAADRADAAGNAVLLFAPHLIETFWVNMSQGARRLERLIEAFTQEISYGMLFLFSIYT